MSRRGSIRMLPLRILLEHPGNVREDLGDLRDLAQSIRAQGILSPIVVTEHSRDGHYLILAGHRRAAAARSIPLDNVPCLIRHDTGNQADQVALMLVENIQRSSLTAIEKARGMQRLLDTGLNQSQVARMIGVTPATVNTHVMLLDLPEDDLAAIERGDVPVSDARQAVKTARKKARTDADKPQRGRPIHVEPRHLAKTHPLARTISELCDHTTRHKVGDVGCGQCWEQAIRDDELTVVMNRQDTP